MKEIEAIADTGATFAKILRNIALKRGAIFIAIGEDAFCVTLT